MPKCPFCDRENAADVNRCQHCGAWVEQRNPAAAAPEPSPPDQPPRGELPAVTPDSLEGEILGLMREGKKIQAIKLYRQQTGAGLKEAKDAVEALAARHGIPAAKAGCAGAVLFLAALSAAAGAAAWRLLA